MKLTKIVATLGPASSSPEMMAKMIREGCNVMRINFSHGGHDEVRKIIAGIRQTDAELGTNTAILADLQGPKIRTGVMAGEGAELITGKEIAISTEEGQGTAERIFTNYKQLPTDVKPGEKILIDDGKIELEILSTNGKNEVKTKILLVEN